MNRKNLLNILNLGLPKTQKEIEELKKEFLLKDSKYKYDLNNGKNVTVDLNESKIQVDIIVGTSIRTVQDDFGFDEEACDYEIEYLNIDFYEEFNKALEISFDNFCKKFTKELNCKGVYTTEGLEGFKKSKLKKTNELIDFIKTGSDIENCIKVYLEEYYSKLYDFISNFKLENYQVSDKFKFKLTKSQLIWLFHSMLDKKVIVGITPTDLYRMLEKNTMYFDKGEFKDMTGVRVQASKLINGSSSPKKSIEELSEKFDTDFFSSIA
tara:strand:+ start:11274 stop:12074 length:801 start_codon:yes stop_codon:yes gene_type:complete